MNPDNPWHSSASYGPYHPEALWFVGAVLAVIAIAVAIERIPYATKLKLSAMGRAFMGLLMIYYFAMIVLQTTYGLWQWITG